MVDEMLTGIVGVRSGNAAVEPAQLISAGGPGWAICLNAIRMGGTTASTLDQWYGQGGLAGLSGGCRHTARDAVHS